MTPTQRSKKLLQDSGYRVFITEHWNAWAKIRQDLFGFADLLCLQEGNKPLLVQVTSAGWNSRVKKILENEHAPLCLNTGFLIEVHGWRKLKTNKGKWTPKIIPITAEDF